MKNYCLFGHTQHVHAVFVNIQRYAFDIDSDVTFMLFQSNFKEIVP